MSGLSDVSHLGVSKVAQLEQGRLVAIQQRVLQLDVPVGNTLNKDMCGM